MSTHTNPTAPKLAFPYPGLRPFEPSESCLFFGRDEHVFEMFSLLEEHRFLSVVGASGSGKSSLVRAGLLPRLRDEGLLNQRDGAWRFLIMRPGNSPLDALADACHLPDKLTGGTLAKGALHGGDPVMTRVVLESGPKGLVRVLGDAAVPDDDNILLLVDQFEELFRFADSDASTDSTATLSQQRNESLQFVALLLETAQQIERPVHVVVTMRTDFMGDCDQFHGLPQVINEGQFLVPRLSWRQLEQAIIKPLQLPDFETEIDRAIVDHMLNAASDERDALPLAQHALLRMWLAAASGEFVGTDSISVDQIVLSNQKKHITESEHYQPSGGLSQALDQHATELYESMTAKQQWVAECLFRCLAELSPKGQLTRRLSSVQEVAGVANVTPEEVIDVVEVFGQPGVNFLMTSPAGAVTDATNIDISHEALLRQWKLLQAWNKKESESVATYRRLLDAVKQGEQVIDGVRLDRAIQWRDTVQPTDAWARRYDGAGKGEDGFLARCLQLIENSANVRESQRRATEQARLEREEAAARELALAQQVAVERDARAATFRRWAIGAFGAATAAIAMSIVAVVLFFQASGHARDAKEFARKAVDSEREAGKQREEAVTQRKIADEKRTEAEREKKEADVAQATAERERVAAVMARDEATKAQGELAVALDTARSATKAEAEAARKAVEARDEAVRNAELAEQNAELGRKLLPYLKEHAAEAITNYADARVADGRPDEALAAYVRLNDLVVGDARGFLLQELLQLDSVESEVLELDQSSVDGQISIPPVVHCTKVLDPAIQLGKSLVAADTSKKIGVQVAKLCGAKARVIVEHFDEHFEKQWPYENPRQIILQSYDQAIQFDPAPAEYYLGRASARYRFSDPTSETFELVVSDLRAGIDRYPAPQDAPTHDKSEEEVRMVSSAAHHALGNVLELLADQDATQGSEQLYQDAVDSHELARKTNREDARYPLGIARVIRKRAARFPSNMANQDEIARAKELLSEARKLNPGLAEVLNELGQVKLLQGKIDEAQLAFSAAVEIGRRDDKPKANLYRYYCNLANTLIRKADDQSNKQAVEEANRAIALGFDDLVQAHYCLGLASWGLKKQSPEALEAFETVLARDADHLGSLLAKSQIIFEMSNPKHELLSEANDSVERAVELADTLAITNAEKSKAHYVDSLKWFKEHFRSKSESESEESLVRCQESLQKSMDYSPTYESFARYIFDYAGKFKWKDAGLRERSETLQQQFKTVVEIEPDASSE